MANKNISDLPSLGSILYSDLLEIQHSGVNYGVTVGVVLTTEAAARAAADTTLTNNLATEVTNRGNADTTLQSDINNRIKKDGTVVFTAIQSHGGFEITNIATPTAGTSATNKNYVLGLTIGDLAAPVSNFSMNTHKITNVVDPTSAQDAVTLSYLQTNGWRIGGTLNTLGNDTSSIGSADNHDFLLKTNNTSRIKFTKAGFVGIGTGSLTPSTVLDVSAADIGSGGATLTLRNIGSGADFTETGIIFNSSIGATTDYAAARIYSKYDGTNAVDNRLSLQINGGAGLVNLLNLNASNIADGLGGVGINITSPHERLHLVGNQKTTGQTYVDKFTLSDGATISLDWNNSNVQYIVLGGDRTFTFSNPKDGGIYTLIIKQDGTGTRLLTWPVAVVWGGGSAPTLTATASKTDTIQLVYDGTNSKYYDLAIKLNH